MNPRQSTSALRAFTLIELLVVIAIISILSTIVYANLALARTRTIDTRKRADLFAVRTAVNAYVLDTGRAPHNYDCSGASCVVNDARTTLAIEDASNPGNPTTESGKAYNASMQELVNAKYLHDIPHSPGGAGYVYYDYGPGSAGGAIIGTSLQTVTDSTSGISGSCRPFPSTGPVSFIDRAIESFRGIISTAYAVNPIQSQNCVYVDPNTNLIYEGPCPPGAHNLCSANYSKDYCLCSAY